MIHVGTVMVCAAVVDFNVSLFAPVHEADSVRLRPNDCVLLTAQTDPAENGVYRADANLFLHRATDHWPSDTIVVSEGTVYRDTMWHCAMPQPIVLDVTALAYAQLCGPAPMHAEPAPVALECSRCGGPLPRPDGTGYADCAHCGVVNRVMP